LKIHPRQSFCPNLEKFLPIERRLKEVQEEKKIPKKTKKQFWAPPKRGSNHKMLNLLNKNLIYFKYL